MNETPVHGLLARIGLCIGLAALALLVLAVGIWGALLLALAGPGNEIVRAALVVALCLASVAILIAVFVRRWRWRAMGAFAVLCAALIVFWTSIEPTNERDWQPDVAILPYATFAGDLVTVHKIRNFDYTSESDYTVAYYDKTFDLRELRSVDIVTSYWMGPAIAHVFVSFGFTGDDYLAISIEVRKSKGKAYSTLRGFFRQYELIYVAADERDVIRLRTNYRGEDVYLYRTLASPGQARERFLEYIKAMNMLHEHPRWYNEVTANCTTSIRTQRSVNQRAPWDWRMLINGTADEMLYEDHAIATGGLPFTELKSRSLINKRAHAADQDPDFSRLIREDLPQRN